MEIIHNKVLFIKIKSGHFCCLKIENKEPSELSITSHKLVAFFLDDNNNCI